MLVLGASLAVASAASAGEVSVQIGIPAPSIRFEAPPPLVVVEPGIQVVQDYDDEVFYVDGWYWHRRGGYWFRTNDWHGGWEMCIRDRLSRAQMPCHAREAPT